MKKFKITDGLLRKVEKRLLKVVQQQYTGDGIYLAVDGIEITAWEDDDFSIEYKIRWGRMADGNCEFQHKASIYAGNKNLDFLAGQFYERIVSDGNE